MTKSYTLKELLSEDNSKKKIVELSFENGLRLMEELVEKVESGTLPLDQSILSYEKGVQLMEHLRGLLTGAEEKLKVLQKSSEKRPRK